MIEKISSILHQNLIGKRPTFSIEIFPPKGNEGERKLFETIEELNKLGPDYISVTYGAGGSTSKSTLQIIKKIQTEFDIPCMHHFTLVNQKVDELARHIDRMWEAGVRNILALRGDPPKEMGGKFRKIDGGLEYCYELIDLIKERYDDFFSIGVAGFPECHVDCSSEEEDTRYLKLKIDHGAQFVVTQMFFSNKYYDRFLDRALNAGIQVPLIPGVLPITDYHRLLTFAETCGAYICEEVHRIFRPVSHDIEETVNQGIRYSLAQCEYLLDRGAPGIHFYCLNRVEPIRTIWRNLLNRVKETVLS